MLLALRRLFGLAADDAADPDAPRRAQKWVIEPVRIGVVARAEELWRYRRIIWFFAKRAVVEKYEGTTLGALWLFIRPLMPIALSAFIFGGLLGVDSGPVPYFLFFLTGMSAWRVFDRAMMWVTRSLEQQRSLIKKVYFPRLAAPISSVAPAVVEFLILLALLIATAMVYWQKDGVMYLRAGTPMLAAFGAIVLTILFSVALGFWTSVWQVRHRDVRYSLRYGLQFWMYVTPVIYPMSMVPEQYRWLAWLNPMAALVETYKWGMLGMGELPRGPLAGAVVTILIVFFGGAAYFNRSEAASVDRL